MARSACVGEATYSVVEAVLLAQFGSLADEHGILMLAVLVMAVPGVSPRLALTTSGKLNVAFAATDAIVQVIVPPVLPTVGSVPQFQPVGTVKETKDVPVGIVSVNVAVPEAAGPLLVTACVYVMLLPSVTGFGVSVLVTLKSACPAVATTSVAVAELLFGFGSVVVDDTFAVSVMTVPEAVPDATVTTTVKVAEAPEASVAFEQVRVPLTTEQLQPAVGDGVADTNVVFAGIASLNATVLAAAAPLFVTTTV